MLTLFETIIEYSLPVAVLLTHHRKVGGDTRGIHCECLQHYRLFPTFLRFASFSICSCSFWIRFDVGLKFVCISPKGSLSRFLVAFVDVNPDLDPYAGPRVETGPEHSPAWRQTTHLRQDPRLSMLAPGDLVGIHRMPPFVLGGR